MTITVGEARALATELLDAAGLDRDDAAATAHALTLAEAWQAGSHGLMRLPYYLDRLASGGYNPSARLDTVTDTGPLVVFDGQAGLGHWQLTRGAELARDRCREYGVAAVAVGNSGHCGALGVYTLPLVDAGLLGLVFSHGPAVMPPWGGHRPVLSTSPLAAGIPCRPRPAIVDMATSASARGKIAQHADRGEAVPDGWAYDADGNPTTDGRTALTGMLAPLGGAKGFALALLVEALTGGLVGPLLSAQVPDMFDPDDDTRPQRLAHLVVALDPERLDAGTDAGTGTRDHDRFGLLAQLIEDAGGRLPGSRRTHPNEISDDALLTVPESVEAELRRRAH